LDHHNNCSIVEEPDDSLPRTRYRRNLSSDAKDWILIRIVAGPDRDPVSPAMDSRSIVEGSVGNVLLRRAQWSHLRRIAAASLKVQSTQPNIGWM